MRLLSSWPFMAALLMFSSVNSVWAQDWPTRPIKMIVPFAAGGSVDVTARGVAQLLSKQLGQPVVVENRAGAGGLIGVNLAAKSAPDGYTIVMASTGTIAISPYIYKTMPYDSLKDLIPITRVVDSVNVMVVPSSSSAKSVKEFIVMAKAIPGKMNFGSSGLGASDQMGAVLFANMAGIKMTNVPYKGGGPAMVDLLAGRLDVMFSAMAPAIEHIKAGRLRALGVTSAKRVEILPNVPTIAEAALPGYESVAWYGLFAPAKTPTDIVHKISLATAQALKNQGLRTRLIASGLVPASSTPEEFKSFVLSETNNWGKLVKASGIKAN